MIVIFIFITSKYVCTLHDTSHLTDGVIIVVCKMRLSMKPAITWFL